MRNHTKQQIASKMNRGFGDSTSSDEEEKTTSVIAGLGNLKFDPDNINCDPAALFKQMTNDEIKKNFKHLDAEQSKCLISRMTCIEP